jgi:hypothetical protein
LLEHFNARRASVITPSDSANLTNGAFALWVGGAGNVNLVTSGGDTVLISGIPAGTYLNIQTSRVLATNTTATLIVGLS